MLVDAVLSATCNKPGAEVRDERHSKSMMTRQKLLSVAFRSTKSIADADTRIQEYTVYNRRVFFWLKDQIWPKINVYYLQSVIFV